MPDPVSTAADIDTVGDVEDALEAFDRDAARAAAEKAEELRKSIVAQFPLDEWPALPLDRYALGGPDHDNFCYVMEFGSEALCSIRGGSARKHAIYRKSSGDWHYDDSYPHVEAAWEAVRGAFVEAFRLAAAGEFEAVDDLRPIRSAAALRTKALYVYFPDEVLPINSSTHLAHFISVLGGSVGQRGAVEANRMLLKLVRERPEFEGWSGHEISTFLYEWADPRRTRLVVKIAPGERAAYWEECRENGYVCIGWDELGDLSQFASQEEFRKAFDDQFSAEYGGNKSKLSVKANEVWTFRELEPGDTVIANRGTNQVVGIGTVVEPGYVWRPEREVCKNTVSVQWTDTTERTLDPPVTSWFGSTVAKVPGDLYQRILGTETQDGRVGVSRPAVSPEPVLPEIRAGLQRRGQVVLYGPPGTGKTYAARRFAAWWLLSRAGAPEASWILGDRDALAERERALSTVRDGDVPQLSMITFHPSYSYEDFVEGYKPKPTDGRGGLELELRDGIFKRICRAAAKDPRPYLLLIDEINRGNVPKIFGELITLIELDKRGISVILPLQRRDILHPAERLHRRDDEHRRPEHPLAGRRPPQAFRLHRTAPRPRGLARRRRRPAGARRVPARAQPAHPQVRRTGEAGRALLLPRQGRQADHALGGLRRTLPLRGPPHPSGVRVRGLLAARRSCSATASSTPSSRSSVRPCSRTPASSSRRCARTSVPATRAVDVHEITEWGRLDIPDVGPPSAEDLMLARQLLWRGATRLRPRGSKLLLDWSYDERLRIRARSWVGVVRVAGHEIRVMPKHTHGSLGVLTMLRYASGAHAGSSSLVPHGPGG